jgi:cell division protein FtsW
MIVMSKVHYRMTLKLSKLGLILSWVLLIAVMLTGDTVFGAKRSLSVGGFSFQPSSLAASTLLLTLSALIAAKQDYVKDFARTFVPAMIWIGITCFLIALEDFSTAGLLFLMSCALLFAGRVPFRTLLLVGILGVLGGYGLVTSSAERTSRVEQFVGNIVELPSQELEGGEGYQAQQAQIAIAQGGLTGVGPGKSTQRNFLPAPYNDFLFAIVAEEYGLIGALVVIGLLTVILLRGILGVAMGVAEPDAALAALACTLFIVLYGYVHASVSVGLFPVTGLPMPFMSYGGSSILFTGAMAGILLNISKSLYKDQDKPFFIG